MRAGPLGFCYCPHTLARFRAWLQRALRLARGASTAPGTTAYGAWDEVAPPRRHTAVPAFIDWRCFMDDVYLTRALEWKTAALKAHDPRRRPVFSHVATPTARSGRRVALGALPVTSSATATIPLGRRSTTGTTQLPSVDGHVSALSGAVERRDAARPTTCAAPPAATAPSGAPSSRAARSAPTCTLAARRPPTISGAGCWPVWPSG